MSNKTTFSIGAALDSNIKRATDCINEQFPDFKAEIVRNNQDDVEMVLSVKLNELTVNFQSAFENFLASLARNTKEYKNLHKTSIKESNE